MRTAGNSATNLDPFTDRNWTVPCCSWLHEIILPHLSEVEESITAIKIDGLAVLSMSMLKENDVSSTSELCSDVFRDLLDSIIIDVASESHRIARLGLDRKFDQEEEELRLSAEARARASDPSHSGEGNGKYVVDIFGQTHPAIASEIFDCMNCGRSIMAGRFAPHLEKCMGKGRKARLKTTRSTTQNRGTRGSPVSVQSANTNPPIMNRVANGSFGVAGDEYMNGTLDEA